MAGKERLDAVVKKLTQKFQKQADERRKYEETRAKFRQQHDVSAKDSIHRELFNAAPSMKKKKTELSVLPAKICGNFSSKVQKDTKPHHLDSCSLAT